MEMEIAVELLRDKRFVQLKSELAEMNPADIASFVEGMAEFDEFGDRELTLLFRILPKELAAEVFTYMDSDFQMVLINAFSDKELRDVIDELYLDDTVDIIEEMPANVVSRILKNTDPDTRKQINQLLNYPKDSAGSVMTTEFVYLQKDSTVKEAFDRIRSIGLVKETVYTCYVTENRKLLGVVTLLEMLVSDYESKMEDIMETNVISVNTHDDQETAAQMLSKYDLSALPVVDNENRLVGILTFDDAMDVIVEENAEDIAMMSAVVPSEKTYLKTSVWTHARNRVVWLLVLMLSATLTGAITNHFEAQIAAIPMLVSFMPMIMGTGGNSGSQASTMIIQGMAMDEVHLRDFFKVVFKEFRIAILCSTILAAVNFVRIFITYRDLAVAAVVSITLIGTVVLAKLLGCMLPMLAKKLHIDPALMSAPLLSTLVDSCSMLLYFTIALNMLNFS
ncbi:MAG: magnesium transporter [Oscillospiraceae bacterium]|nr:magnesium transporter [Oscillospiraceae bacterium]MBQ8827339.1 magnesium transporter [Oscillospiraceae bacterium]MBQ9139303.1 magnesium transporter [Ruminococcus sp.]